MSRIANTHAVLINGGGWSVLRSFTRYGQIVFGLLSTLAAGTAIAADPDIETIRRELVSPWIVDVQGETRTRTLNILGAEPGTDGTWILQATYGLTDENQSAIRAQLRVVSNVYQLEFTTQPGTVVIAESSGGGTFRGTFTPRSGSARSVKLERTSDEEIKKRLASLAASRATLKAEAENWLKRDKFHVYIPETGFLYQTYPKEGYTYMIGWSDQCGQGKVPTAYSVDEQGKLTLEFNIELRGCPHFKYVFTGAKGQNFVQDGNGKWNLRKLVMELRD